MGLILYTGGSGCHSVADARKGKGDSVILVTSIENLLDIFRFSASQFAPVSTLEIVAHGAGARLALGGSTLGLDQLSQLSDPAVSQSFALGATVTFISCDIASNPEGERWIAEFGRHVLRKFGGTVSGAKAKVVANQATGGYGVPLEGWVKATVTPGGAVTLQGQTTLVQDLVLRRACEVQRLMRTELARPQGPRVKYDPTFLDPDIKDLSRSKVDGRLKGYEFLWILHDYLASTEAQLRRLGYEVTPT
jgi:hypothetical protein